VEMAGEGRRRKGDDYNDDDDDYGSLEIRTSKRIGREISSDHIAYISTLLCSGYLYLAC